MALSVTNYLLGENSMQATSPRLIESDAVYQLDEIKDRLGVRKAAWRTMLRQGLPVIRIGRRGYVKGADAIAFLDTLKERQR